MIFARECALVWPKLWESSTHQQEAGRTFHRSEVYTPGHLAAAQYPRMLARKPLKAAVANEEAGRWQVVGGAVGAGGSIF